MQSNIQWEIGVAVVKIGFAIGGHSEHTRRQHVVLLLTLSGAESTTQLALFVSVKVIVFIKAILFLSVNL